MKLIIIIPAYNEAESIAKVIGEIPGNIKGIEKIELLVVDDGSTDETAKIARKAGVSHLISNRRNMGLAHSFKKGLEKSLELGADIIVNIDADAQYNAREIPKIIQPILEGKAEMVIGDRQIRKLKHMKFSKKYGNLILSWMLKKILENNIGDASSGFRAFSRECASKLNIFSGYTYTHETIIQCTFEKMRIANVPIEFRERKDGQSRLIKNVWDYAKLSGSTILRACLIYNPLKIFFSLGLIVLLIAAAVAVVSLVFMHDFMDTTFTVLCATALQACFFGLLAELIIHFKK